MDTSSLTRGQQIAGASAIALLIFAFFGWFESGFFEANGWQASSFIRDLILLLTIVGGVALAVSAIRDATRDMPVSLSAVVTGIALLNTILILIWVIDPIGADGVDRAFGLFLSLIASAGVAYGAWRVMQEEGTSFRGEADRIQTHRDPAGPPPPPTV